MNQVNGDHRMKVLVLGSEGCIGGAVSRYLEEQGDNVVHWDIKMGEEYDLRKKNNLEKILPEVDIVIFLAYDVGGSKYNIQSLQYIENNMDLMRHTFHSLQQYGKPFIYASSMMSNMNNNPYAVLKRLGELYTDILGGISVKLWNVYGSEPVTEKSHVIPDFIHQAIHNDCIKMRTAGNEERLFLYCEDLAKAIHIICKDYDSFKGNSELDISIRGWVTIKEVAYIIKDLTKEIMNKDIEVYEGTYIDNFHNRKNEPTESKLDTVWKPTITLKEGIRKVYYSMLS